MNSSKSPTLSAFCSNAASSDLRNLLNQIRSTPHGDNRRTNVRVARSLFLTVQPLDENLEPVGEPFSSMTRDVSSTGVGFLHDSAFPTNFVRVGPNLHSPSQAIGRVCYNRSISDDKAATFLVGVEFLEGPFEQA